MAEITIGLWAAPLSTASAEDWENIIFSHEMPTEAQWHGLYENHWRPSHTSLDDRLAAGFNETDGLE